MAAHPHRLPPDHAVSDRTHPPGCLPAAAARRRPPHTRPVAREGSRKNTCVPRSRENSGPHAMPDRENPRLRMTSHHCWKVTGRAQRQWMIDQGRAPESRKPQARAHHVRCRSRAPIPVRRAKVPPRVHRAIPTMAAPRFRDPTEYPRLDNTLPNSSWPELFRMRRENQGPPACKSFGIPARSAEWISCKATTSALIRARMARTDS